MHIARVSARGFRRFSHLTVRFPTQRPKLVVLVGPNGSGKSSVFDAFVVWHWYNGGPASVQDPQYHEKAGAGTAANIINRVTVEFHEGLVIPDAEKKRLFYIRSAYRHQPDFTIQNLERTGPVLDAPRVARLIDADATVSGNYQRAISATLAGVFDGQHDQSTVRELREELIGRVRESMSRVFEDLLLSGLGDPLKDGSFYFDKGASRRFHYKNLSAGEKAAFDLLLDVHLKRDAYSDSVYCIDEPEIHMHTQLQARLLDELVRVVPDSCQIWIATHSVGMMRHAKALYDAAPSRVAFLDFTGLNLDEEVNLEPVVPSRELWRRTLAVALGDIGELVAPSRIVLCEGTPNARPDKAEFDAQCYRRIFGAEVADADFISVGNAADVQSDRLGIGRAIQAISRNTAVTRLIDRDARSDEEIWQLEQEGVRVLRRRHLEAYLLDDELLAKLCTHCGRADAIPALLAAKQKALSDSVGRGNAVDDIKSAGGAIRVAAASVLKLPNAGSTAEAFMRDTMVPLATPDTGVYKELKEVIFPP